MGLGGGGALKGGITSLDACSMVSFGAETRVGWKLDKYAQTVTIWSNILAIFNGIVLVKIKKCFIWPITRSM